MSQRHWLMVFSLVSAACSGSSEPLDSGSSALSPSKLQKSQFVEVASHLARSEALDAWYSIVFALEADFDAICGDTFCEGDYSNIQSLGIRCSVQQTSGRIGSCKWTFAASSEQVVPDSGEIRIESRVWRCELPVPRGVRVSTMIGALSGHYQEPLYAALPGTERSVFDGLVDCL